MLSRRDCAGSRVASSSGWCAVAAAEAAGAGWPASMWSLSVVSVCVESVSEVSVVVPVSAAEAARSVMLVEGSMGPVAEEALARVRECTAAAGPARDEAELLMVIRVRDPGGYVDDCGGRLAT